MNRHFHGKLFLTLLTGGVLATITGCATNNDITAEITPLKPQLSDAELLASGASGDPSNWPQLSWVTQFNDPQLEQLLAEALEQNPDLQTAQARVRVALAKSEEMGAARGFSGQIGAQISRTRLPLALEPFNANVAGNNLPVDVTLNPWVTPTGILAGASYEFDLWGKKAALSHALQSDQAAAVIDVQQARLTLTTTLAKLYCQLDYYSALGELLLEQLSLYESIENLANARVSQGLDSGFDRNDAQLKHNALATQQLLNEQNLTLTQMQLGLLVGGSAERGLKLSHPKLSAIADSSLATQLSANLLGRRPDIVAARLRVEALLAKAESTKAAFYPDINLNALAGFMTTDVASLLSSQAITASIGPAISLPIFERDRIRARLRSDYANVDLAVIAYNKIVNQAFADVAQQLTSISTTDLIIEQQTEAVTAATNITDIAIARHDRGIGTIKTTLETKLAMIGEKQRLLALRSQRRTLQIELVRALGGGFNAGQYATGLNPATSSATKQTP